MRWASRSTLLADPAVRLLGFQPGARGHLSGYFLFEHGPCGTSFLLRLSDFEQLEPYPVLSANSWTQEEKAKFCLAARAGDPCIAECVCTFVYRMSERIRNWPKEIRP